MSIHDDGTCTPATMGFTCEQQAICEEDFNDIGFIVSCCDGEHWVELAADTDLCGIPE